MRSFGFGTGNRETEEQRGAVEAELRQVGGRGTAIDLMKNTSVLTCGKIHEICQFLYVNFFRQMFFHIRDRTENPFHLNGNRRCFGLIAA